MQGDSDKRRDREREKLTEGRRFEFRALDTEASGITFIQYKFNKKEGEEEETAISRFADPIELLRKICVDIKASGKSRTRYLHRIIPIQTVCLAKLEDIERFLTPLLATVNDPSFTPSTVRLFP